MQYPRLDDGSPIRRLWDLDHQTADHLSTGIEHRDGREGRIRASTWSVYTRIGEALQAAGSSLDEMVRQRIVVGDPADLLPVEDVISQVFAGHQLPATVLTCGSFLGSNESVGLGIEIIAFRESDGADLSRVRISNLASLTDPYPQAVRVGQLVFSSSIYDTDASGVGLSTPNTSSPTRSGRAISDQTHLSLRRQLLNCFAHLGSILDDQGADLHSIMRQTFFTTSNRQAWGYTSLDRQQLFPQPEDFPTASAFGVQALPPNSQTEVMTDAIGLAPGEWKRESDIIPEVTMGHLPMCITAGPFIFTTGYVGMKKAEHDSVRSYRDLEGPERLLGFVTADRWELVRAQAWHIYRQIIGILKRHTSRAELVVQQTIYLTDLASFPVVESVARTVFGNSLPATTVIGVENIGPYPDADIEIDVIAVKSPGVDAL